MENITIDWYSCADASFCYSWQTVHSLQLLVCMFLSFYLCALVSSLLFLSYQEKIYKPHTRFMQWLLFVDTTTCSLIFIQSIITTFSLWVCFNILVFPSCFRIAAICVVLCSSVHGPVVSWQLLYSTRPSLADVAVCLEAARLWLAALWLWV